MLRHKIEYRSSTFWRPILTLQSSSKVKRQACRKGWNFGFLRGSKLMILAEIFLRMPCPTDNSCLGMGPPWGYNHTEACGSWDEVWRACTPWGGLGMRGFLLIVVQWAVSELESFHHGCVGGDFIPRKLTVNFQNPHISPVSYYNKTPIKSFGVLVCSGKITTVWKGLQR